MEETTNEYQPEFKILYEDNHVIVVLKPQNVASCGDESGDKNLLDMIKEYIKIKYNKPGNAYVGLVHRLDRPTGGIMVYAKSSKAAARLSGQISDGGFEKRYLTVLYGTPTLERGTLVNYLKKNTVNNMVYVCNQYTEGAKEARLEYRVLEDKVKYSLVEVKLYTGRSHQIRVQMAALNHPVFGDMRYGGALAQKGKLALWAYSLSFYHPISGEKLKFIYIPPEDEAPWNIFSIKKSLGFADD